MPKEKEQNPIYICPECQALDKKCQACNGLGVVLFLQNEIFHWNRPLSRLRIGQARQTRKVRVLINTLFFAFGIAGLISLFKVFYDLYTSHVLLYNFIYVQNEYTLVFWISMLADMYLLYRISRESKVRFLIKQKPLLHIRHKLKVDNLFNWSQVSKYKKQDISKAFDQKSLQVIEDTWLLADKLDHAELDDIHLFITLLSNTQVNLVFARLGVDYKKLSQRVKNALQKITQTGSTELSVNFKQILLNAYLRAYNQRKKKVTPTDLLFAVSSFKGTVKEILYDLEITQREIADVVAWVDLQRFLISQWREFKYRARLKPKTAMNRAYTAIATPNLDRISRDMTLFARAGGYDVCINREKELAELFRILEADKLGAVLVGQPGVGKKTIVEGVAQLMVKEEVPKTFQDKRLVSLSVSGLIAGAAQIGELENRILNVMREVGRSKNIILFIEDIHHLVGVSTDTGESMDAAEALAEQMQKNNFLVLATTTPKFYKKYIENSSLAKTLQKVVVNEPEEDEAVRVLEAKALNLEVEHKIYFSYQSLREVARLSQRYLHDEYLPEKAIKILEEVALAVRQTRGEKAVITKDDIATIISDLTNIPASKIASDESQKLLNLEQKMHERIIGQDEAVKLVASALRRARTQLRGRNKPIASFLFLGPTGVGKTEVAKTLARVYFGSEKNMVRMDMSEYQASDALAKLIGDARLNQGGYLTEKVRKTPFTLVLLDEIEKATPDILNIFLQVLDDGRLTDATGRTIDFTNTIIIGTSNAGTGFIQEGIKQGKELTQIREILINQHLNKYFRPELLNRFDGIVVFHPLTIEHVNEIAKLFLDELAARLEEKGILFKAEPEAVAELANLGFDPTLGARPLRRVIQDRVEDALAKLFLEKKVDRRDQVILTKGLELKVEKAKIL